MKGWGLGCINCSGINARRKGASNDHQILRQTSLNQYSSPGITCDVPEQ